MLPKRFFRLGVVLHLLVLIGCSESNDSLPTTPTVKTLRADVAAVGGAVFSGELSVYEVVEDHGFVLSSDSTFSGYNVMWLSSGTPSKSGPFNYELTTGLEKDKVYFFRAFMILSGRIVYGDTKSFLSNGSLPPVIETVSPQKGYIGSTVHIAGQNLNWKGSYYTRVILGEVEVSPTSVSDTSITIVIPPHIKSSKFPIRVRVFDKEAEGGSFELYTPEVYSIEPASATFRDIVTLRGMHFDSVPERNMLFLGDDKATILSSSRTEIKFVVPDEFRSDRARVRIQSQIQEVESPDFFTLKQPVIGSFPNCTQSLAEFEIIGENFHPIAGLNHVSFGGTEAEVISGDTKRLLVKVPHGPFPDAKTKVSVRIAETPVVHQDDVCIEDIWVMISDQLPFIYYGGIGTFTTDDRAYVFSDQKLWIYNPDDAKWIGQDIPFDLGYSTGSSTYNGRKAYVYTADYHNNFWEYDPATSKWVQKADFPGHIRHGSAMFSIGGRVYLGIGRFSSGIISMDPLHDFYRYDPSKNQWVEIQSLTTDQYQGRARMSSFVIGSNAYLVGGALNSGHYQAWKFNGVTEKWESIADMPEVVSYTSSFVYKGKGYVTTAGGLGIEGKTCFEYNPDSNTWGQFYPVGHLGRFNGFAFTLRGIPYVGGGYQSSSDIDVSRQMFQLLNPH